MKYASIHIIIAVFLLACVSEAPLPKIGFSKIENGDTVHHVIPSFEFVNQNNEIISNSDFKDNIYITDFFFTSCPSICPKVKIEMLKIYDTFESNETVKLVSHTLDPKRDTVEKLNEYASHLEVDKKKWHFLTGEKDALWDIANEYFVTALEDPDAPGGLEHSGKILLIDKAGHIRAYSEGTNPKSTPGFIKNIKRLLREYE